jgi:hypothetical protein
MNELQTTGIVIDHRSRSSGGFDSYSRLLFPVVRFETQDGKTVPLVLRQVDADAAASSSRRGVDVVADQVHTEVPSRRAHCRGALIRLGNYARPYALSHLLVLTNCIAVRARAPLSRLRFVSCYHPMQAKA